MATLNITPVLPTAPSGFAATSTGPLSVKIQWNVLQPGERCEVWRHTVNDVALASKIVTVEDVTYTDTNFTVGGTYYYWLRTINQYDVVGAYDVANTSGHSVVVAGVNTVNIVSSAVNNIAVVETPSVNIQNSYTGWTDVENFTFVSGGYTTIIDSSLGTQYHSWSRPTAGDSFYLWMERLIIDETAGGADTSMAKSTYGTFTYKDFGTTGQDFTNPTNVQTEDGVFCEGVVSAGIDDIYFYGYDFHSIPDTATIQGIEVKVKCKHTKVGTGTPSFTVKLCWDGTNFSTDGGKFISQPSTITTTATNTLYTIGNSYCTSKDWGGRWNSFTAADYRDITIADIKDASFGVMLAPNGATGLNGTTYHIDFVEITVYYTTKIVVDQVNTLLMNLPGNTYVVTTTGQNYTAVADLTLGHTYRHITRVTGEQTGTGLNFYWTPDHVTSIVREVKR